MTSYFFRDRPSKFGTIPKNLGRMVTLLTRYLEKHLTDFHQIYGIEAFWDRGEHFRFWGQKVKVQGNTALKMEAYSTQCIKFLVFINVCVGEVSSEEKCWFSVEKKQDVIVTKCDHTHL